MHRPGARVAVTPDRGQKRGSVAGSSAREDEAALLGSLLVLGDNHERLTKRLGIDARDLRASRHADVFLAIASWTRGGRLPDHETVINELQRTRKMSLEEAEQLVALLIARAPRQPHVYEYARRVRERRV
jgi:replicative DNA helicase